jgi:hypothetical protein
MGKVRNREDIEDRTMDYRDKRRSYRFGYTQDVDQLEYEFYGDEIVFVASLELTRADYHPDHPDGPTDNYFDKILARFHYDAQAKFSKKVADALGIESYIVTFYHDLTKYWVYNLSQETGWEKYTESEYFKWLEKLHNNAILNEINREKREKQEKRHEEILG